MIKAKICGITTKEAIKTAVEYKAAYIGFVFFAKSPRNITPEKAAELAKMAGNAKTAAVLVNPADSEIDDILQHFKPDFLQLHGAETLSEVTRIKNKYKIPVIKAISVKSGDDIASGKAYEVAADMLLFDAKVSGNLPGGNGLAFDWELLKGHQFKLPWILSGGLNIENIEEAVKRTGAKAVDISSGLESEPGVKNPELIKQFLQKVKNL